MFTLINDPKGSLSDPPLHVVMASDHIRSALHQQICPGGSWTTPI